MANEERGGEGECDVFLLLLTLLSELCSVVSSKEEAERAAARKTIVQIARELGSNYLLYLLTELGVILRNGPQVNFLFFVLFLFFVFCFILLYFFVCNLLNVQRHVYGAVLHAVVVELSSNMKPGEIDYCYPTISKVFLILSFNFYCLILFCSIS